MKKICYKSNSLEIAWRQGFIEIIKLITNEMPEENLVVFNELIIKSSL